MEQVNSQRPLEQLTCIILAGGKGTRLQSVVSDVPKPMAPIGGTPFVELLIDQLVRQGVRHIVLSVGYKRESIIGYFQKNIWPGLTIKFVEEKTPLGTGGAIKFAAQSFPADNYLVLNGDSYCQSDLNAFVNHVGARQLRLGVLTNQQQDCARYGKLLVDDTTHRVVSMEEKNADAGAGLINAGVYYLNDEFLSQQCPKGAFSFEEVAFPLLIKAGLCAYTQSGRFIDIGIPEDYAYLNQHKSKFFPGFSFA